MLAISALGTERHAFATDWSATLQAATDAAFVTNPRMLAGADTTDETAQVMLNGSAIAQTERSELTLTPRFQLTRYDHQTDLNTDYLSLGLTYQENLERGNWILEGTTSSDSTLTSELGTTGISFVNVRHSASSADWSLQYSSTERLMWRTQIGAQVTRYDRTDLGLVDYDYGSVSIGPRWSFTERIQGSLSLEADRLNPKSGTPQNDYTASMQLQRSFSERYAWHASIGETRIDYGQTPQSRSQTSSTVQYELGASFTGERTQWDLSVRRAVMPIGFGLLAPQTTATLTVVANLSETSTLTLTLNGIRTEAVSVSQTALYGGASWAQAAIEWRHKFSLHWAVSLGYRQGRSRATSADEWANGNQAHLGVVWDSGKL